MDSTAKRQRVLGVSETFIRIEMTLQSVIVSKIRGIVYGKLMI